MRPGSSDATKRGKSEATESSPLIQFCVLAVVTPFAIMTAIYAWRWYVRFEATGQDRLGKTSLALAGITITGLAIAACLILFCATLVILGSLMNRKPSLQELQPRVGGISSVGVQTGPRFAGSGRNDRDVGGGAANDQV
ncbi:hypothetical protein DL766_009404 [Monosporascus sp. MC13-8B]|nr:hypothetical protein DL766_009404 [Monosporascus sp. MC13-8B]